MPSAIVSSRHPAASKRFCGGTPEEQTLGKFRSSRATGPYDLHLFPVAPHPHSLLGTCAMGSGSDPLAVCDGVGRVRGLDGVVVADCSLMPTIPRANTNLPAILVGARITDALLEA